MKKNSIFKQAAFLAAAGILVRLLVCYIEVH